MTFSWEDAEKELQEFCVQPVLYAVQNEKKPDVEVFNHSYSMVYTLCTQKPPHNYSHECYRFLEEIAENHAMTPGAKRNRFLFLLMCIFKNLDRFYVKRLNIPEI